MTMVTRARRNLARKEAPPKAVVTRNKTKDLKKPTTLYLMYFFLALLVISGVVEMQRHMKVSKKFLSRFRF